MLAVIGPGGTTAKQKACIFLYILGMAAMNVRYKLHTAKIVIKMRQMGFIHIAIIISSHLSNKREWNNCFIKHSHKISIKIKVLTLFLK